MGRCGDMVDLIVTSKTGSRERQDVHSRVRIELHANWPDAATKWDWSDCSENHAPFQHPDWLASWYAAFAPTAMEPLIAIAYDNEGDAPIALLPLIRHRRHGVRIVEFADCDLTDNNAPLLAAPACDPALAAAVWPALRKALRRATGGVDVIRLRKMPRVIGGANNPLTLLPAARQSSLNSNLVITGEDFDAHRFTLGRNERSQLRRKWRGFSADPSNLFRLVTGRDEALHLLDIIDQQQRSRMNALGKRFVLNEGANGAFYRNLVRNGIAQGLVTITVLSASDEIVAGTFGVRSGRRWTLIRSSLGSERWLKYSPGVLLIDQTMAALHADGVREFDFSIGEYDYKRRLGAFHVPLFDLTSALTLRGVPHTVRDRAAYRLRQHPRLRNRVRRLLGKPVAREEDV